ncbi:MerR family transcriptional regulator [Metabacillus sp. GX 13764]|uniref:MerR family transcriptional regulator n=1 Tax=Metabacillus kandeliae TaxID=2900151 RepID=UPI001E455564|nr:MerR family transcriptional regulator [Metabacillus kandeliae]MCD7036200.1 MerR family transcriptional regulator [Metabacillus kandeliae]
MQENHSYRDKKVISIGTVSEITGLSVRQIRYYEERQLIYPERTDKGTRKYSFTDIERLMEIADMREEGVQTSEILKDFKKKENKEAMSKDIRKKMLQGQLNAHFRVQPESHK